MATDGSDEWHRIGDAVSPETTVRHSEPHRVELSSWARQHELSGIFDAVALTFGFTENFTIIGNLSRELSQPEADSLLTQWADNPYITHLTRLRDAYFQSPEISFLYAGITHAGTADQTRAMLRRSGAVIAKQHFLLTMIINPLAQAPTATIYGLRRMLRIWLLVQALMRTVEQGCCRDQQIQVMASALTLDTLAPKWEVIDRILEHALRILGAPVFSYGQFTLALQRAAERLKPVYSGSSDRPTRQLLQALVTVAQGHCNPIRGHQEEPAAAMPAFTGIRPDTDGGWLPRRPGEPPLALVSVTPCGDTEEEDEEDPAQCLWVDVADESTPGQQRLSGRSVLLQTAELAHYLPWSWDKALPPELMALERWIEQTLITSNPADQLGAAVTWLAMTFARSLPFVLEFAITDTPQEEWSLSTDFTIAHRQPPRRHSSWQPDATHANCVEAFSECLAVTLPAAVSEVLQARSTAQTGAVTFLHDLWFRTNRLSAQDWFREQAQTHFPRVTGAMLANIQPQRIFARTADPALARLASSHPRSALPAACGYANWDIQQVEQGFGLRLTPDSRAPGGRLNLLGSVLAPLESLLVDGVSQARRQLQALDKDPLAYHNALVRYSVMALYAATGCRHLSEPFESIQDFCTSPPAVFINDKSDDGLHAGRLVPLPEGALDLLAHYREHLACLQRAVDAQRPSLAQAIDRVLKGQSSHLPLFFLLDRSGRWHSLNDGSLPGAGTMPWPLPKNLFRHRYAQQLARQGVPSEVIEGWMGHAERGVASYGDHSPRCWLDDAHRYRDKIHDCFERLGFQVPAIAPKLSALALEPEGPGYSEPTLFGYAKRALERQRARDRARASARRELDLYLGAHPYESLTQDYVDALAKRMLLRENGLPHPLAQVRFEVLVQWLEDGEPQDHRFIRRRLAQLEAERSRVRRQCPQVLQLMPELRRWAKCTRKALRQTQVSKAAGLAVAVCFLVIEKRLTYARLLEDLIQGKHFRLIQHQRRVFMEYSEALTPDDFEQPVQRHEIDHTSARLLGRGLGIKATMDLDSHPCPTVLASLVTLLSGFQASQGNASPSLGWLLRTLRRCVAQANLIELPGILAAALSERNPPTSTRLIDTLRITEGRYYPLPDTADPEPIPELADLPKVPTLRPSAAASARGHEAARTFFLELHHRLNGYRKSGALALAKDIDSYCKSQSIRVSSAVLLVGYWIAHRVRQGKGKHHQKHNPYAAGAIKRYLSALTQAFVGIASDTDLLRLDEDEVTDLCARMLTLKSQKEVDRQYFAARLREFFVWAGERGVSEPNWDDLDLGNAGRSVRPGLFSETEYHQCLSTLLQASTEASDRGLMAAFVLMLAYRFGLRAREAIGLRRKDWCQAGGLTWVLVRNNPFRTLKNAHNSRRAVPLMFDLSEDECTLIHTLLARYETLAGQTDNGPLLCALADHKVTLTPLERHLPSDIAIVLKQVTGNERMTLHQARHAFCNRLAAALFDIDTPLTRALVGQQDAREIRTLLLGTPELPSRRCAMAIARAMGHQTPATSLRSYHHLLTEWADRLTPVDSHYVSRIAGAIHTDGCPTKAPSPDTGPSIFARPPELTPLRALQALRLFAMGYTAERAERLLRLAPGELTELERLANKVNARMRFKVLDPLSNTPHQVYGEDYPGLLLKSRPTVMWQRLLQWATDLPAMVPPEAPVTLPPLEEVPDLVGRNGHLLMNTPPHAHLLKSVIDAFRIPSTGYAAVVRGKPDSLSRATALLESVGFEVSTDARGQLDTFNADSREEFFRARSYAGLMVTKSATGPVCNGVELVLVFIAVAVCWCPRTATG